MLWSVCSAILYRGKTRIEWGWPAQARWQALSARERESHHYLEGFKLALHEGANIKLPDGLSATQVAADYLAMLKDLVMEQLQAAAAATKGVGSISDDQVLWVLGFPELWSQAERRKMRNAAERAGMQSSSLLFATEPELAALYGMTASGMDLTPGSTVLVVDAGGGTVDVSMHDVQLQGGQAVLSEHTIGEAALAGATFVDRKWECWMQERLGQEAWADWKASSPSEWLWLRRQWECIKHEYAGSTSGATPASAAAVTPATLRLPDALLTATKGQGATAGGAASRLELDSVTLAALFDPVVDKCVETALQVVARADRPPDVALLAGGFCESPYLSARLEEALKAAGVGKVAALPHAGSAVTQGAVISGLAPQAIYARRSRLTYGVDTCSSFEEGDPLEHRFWHSEDSKYCTDSVFKPYVVRGELVHVDQSQYHTFSPLYSTQKGVSFKIYATADVPEQGAALFKAGSGRRMYITDEGMQELAEVELSWPAGAIKAAGGKRAYTLGCKFFFGGSEVRVVASDEHSGRSADASVRFAHEVTESAGSSSSSTTGSRRSAGRRRASQEAAARLAAGVARMGAAPGGGGRAAAVAVRRLAGGRPFRPARLAACRVAAVARF